MAPGEYCAENACVNAAVHRLHMDALNRVPGAEARIEQFVLPCVMMRELLAPAGNGGAQSDAAGLVLRCPCGCPGHDIAAYKPSLCTGEPARPTMRQRRPISLPLADMMPPTEDTFRFENLPDLGFFIRTVLQKRFYTPALRKHYERVSQGGGLQRQMHSTGRGRGAAPQQPHREPTPVEAVVDGLCCSIIQVRRSTAGRTPPGRR